MNDLASEVYELEELVEEYLAQDSLRRTEVFSRSVLNRVGAKIHIRSAREFLHLGDTGWESNMSESGVLHYCKVVRMGIQTLHSSRYIDGGLEYLWKSINGQIDWIEMMAQFREE